MNANQHPVCPRRTLPAGATILIQRTASRAPPRGPHPPAPGTRGLLTAPQTHQTYRSLRHWLLIQPGALRPRLPGAPLLSVPPSDLCCWLSLTSCGVKRQPRTLPIPLSCFPFLRALKTSAREARVQLSVACSPGAVFVRVATVSSWLHLRPRTVAGTQKASLSTC